MTYKELLQVLQREKTALLECNVEDMDSVEKTLRKEQGLHGVQGLLKIEQVQHGLKCTLLQNEEW